MICLTHTSRGTSALLALSVALLVISCSIAAPILFRPFYYLQIGPLGLTEATGLSHETIRVAYDQLLDFCAGAAPFRTGVLSCSPSAQQHFVDVQRLFRLDFLLLALSAVTTVGLLLRCRAKKLTFHRFWGRGPGFWAGSLTAGLFLLVSALAALNFDAAFVVFHHLLFPGADNWILDPAVDGIITILPELFFRNCALAIVAVLLCCCAGLVLTDLLRARRART